MGEVVSVTAEVPGFRLLSGITAVSIRFLAGDTSARAAVEAQGLPWVQSPGEMAGTDPFVCWRAPQERFAIGLNAAPLRALLASLAPGQHDLAFAIDVSEALTVFELHGPQLESWLVRVVDATAVPREAGSMSRCRFADVPVLLLRKAVDCLWLVAERPLAPYIADWLEYTRSAVSATGELH